MELRPKFYRAIEIYNCVVLTIIAALLLAILLRTPVAFTYKNLEAGKVNEGDIPLVRVLGGHIAVSTR